MTYERKTTDTLISMELRTILMTIESESIVAALLLKKRHNRDELVDNPVNYISVSTDDRSKMSYLTEERIGDLTEDVYWTSSRRFQARPGAFISKLFKNIPAKEVEKFSNLFKSQAVKSSFNFKVFRGENIRKYYDRSTYANTKGSLGSSCMNHTECSELFDVYTDNEEVSMLVMRDENKKVMGRSILWDFGSYKIMDRIYTNRDEELSFHFKKWATDNGYLYKSEQNWCNSLQFEQIGSKKQEVKLEIKFKMDQPKKWLYPYMDTFKFIDINTGKLYNYIPEDEYGIRTLCASDGSKYESDHLRLDIVDRVYRVRGDCVYLDYLSAYTISNNAEYSDINDQYILQKDSKFNHEINDYVFNEKLDKFNDNFKIEDRIKILKALKENKEKNGDKKKGPYSSRVLREFSEYIASSGLPIENIAAIENISDLLPSEEEGSELAF